MSIAEEAKRVYEAEIEELGLDSLVETEAILADGSKVSLEGR